IKYRRYYIYYLLKSAILVMRLLPLGVLKGIAWSLGRLAYYALPWYSGITSENLARALDISVWEAKKAARDVFSNVAMNGAEWIKLSILRPDDLGKLITETEGMENLEEALREGKGIIIIASHFGNWELMPMFIRNRGYHGAIVARRIYFYKYDKLITRLRRRFNVSVIYRDESPRKILKVLKENGIMGIVPDQDVDSIEGVFVDFFGMPAYTPTAPVKLAMATGAKMIPAFVVRKDDGTHKLVVDKSINIEPGRKGEEMIIKYTQEWTKVLERYVRMYPGQWVWMHKRWKTAKTAPDRDSGQTIEVGLS
ncbi:MAG: lysophospholipid acyltransferase family protein, partial [Candidatus Omnitrophica bacterium]|nr:lysophospholipid acyltransferase family protein [Candidatus Omnitrophota bacterium]